MPWRDDVAAILLTYFPGQEFGDALADMLLGDDEPGGRLPTTWPADEDDIPVIDVTPTDGKVGYDEGIHIGYRAWLRDGAIVGLPLRPRSRLHHLAIDSATAPTAIRTGETRRHRPVQHRRSRRASRSCRSTPSAPTSAVDRPVRWLVGFADVHLSPGESADVAVDVRGRELAHWAEGWSWEPGEFTLHVGSSVADTPVQLQISVK